jgi:hypothetical protein
MIRPFLIPRFTRQLRRAAFLLMMVVTTTAFFGAPDAQAQQSNVLEARVSKVLDGVLSRCVASRAGSVSGGLMRQSGTSEVALLRQRLCIA